MNNKLFEAGLRLSAVCSILERLDMATVDDGHKQQFLLHLRALQRTCQRADLNGEVRQLAVCQHCGKVYVKKKTYQQYCHPYCRKNAWIKKQRNARETQGKEARSNARSPSH